MKAGGPAPAPEAEAAVARMREMSVDLRGCAVIAESGEVLASTDGSRRWAKAGPAFLAAADEAGSERAEHVHVATEEGEAFAVRDGNVAMVAVADRFTLASLMVFDMRTVLRDLARAGGGKGT
jgi:hypothetical protein